MKSNEFDKTALAGLWPGPVILALCGPHRRPRPEIWFQSVLYKNNIGTRSLAGPLEPNSEGMKGGPQTSGTIKLSSTLHMISRMQKTGFQCLWHLGDGLSSYTVPCLECRARWRQLAQPVIRHVKFKSYGACSQSGVKIITLCGLIFGARFWTQNASTTKCNALFGVGGRPQNAGHVRAASLRSGATVARGHTTRLGNTV